MTKIIIDKIESNIHTIRGIQVILDKDLAELYQVKTKRLNEQVKRNIERFPSDFMFQLTSEELNIISRSQFATLKQGKNTKYLPYAFTELGISMLSSVLRSKIAIQVNIQIMRVFVELRRYISEHPEVTELKQRIDAIEEKQKSREPIEKEMILAIKYLMATVDPNTTIL